MQLQSLGTVVGDLRVDGQAFGDFQANQVIAPLRLDRRDLAVQLVARAGAQHQSTEQVQVTGIFSRFQHLSLQRLQLLIQAQHSFAFAGQLGATTALAADTALHQRFLREVVQLIDGVPRRLVTQPRAFRGAGDRALFGDVLQQGNALRAADNVLG
ncbi:hypothetical protein D3C85_1438810 [compost metagenome]